MYSPPSRRREFCHSAAPPTPFSRSFDMDGKGVSVKWQSRRGLFPPSSRQGWWSRYSNTSPTVVPGLSTCGCGRLSWTIVTQARTHSRSSGTGSRSTAAPSAGAGMCSTVLRFFHFLYWTIVTQGPCWRRHRERERHAPPFLTVVTVLSLSPNYSDRVGTVLGHRTITSRSTRTSALGSSGFSG